MPITRRVPAEAEWTVSTRHAFRSTFVRMPWVAGVVAFAVVAIWRGVLMLGPSQGSGPGMVLHFVALMLTPFLFLSVHGRTTLGLSRAPEPAWIPWAILLGAVSAVVAWWVGLLLFGQSQDNWYVTVSATLMRDPRLGGMGPSALFLTLAIPAALFSPMGEELFFRGVFHDAVAERLGQEAATAANAAAFGLMHLFHHGVALSPAGVDWRPVSGLLWVVITMGLGVLFTVCRQRGGSIWAPVVAHSAFNVSMVAIIVGVVCR
jgi:membrane protease YdiL (CAAX protease family)